MATEAGLLPMDISTLLQGEVQPSNSEDLQESLFIQELMTSQGVSASG